MESGLPRLYWEEHPGKEKGRSGTGQGELAGGDAALKSLREPSAKGAIGGGLALGASGQPQVPPLCSAVGRGHGEKGWVPP